MNNSTQRLGGELLILTWHAVDERRAVISISPEMFREQMRALAALKLRGISLAAAFEHFRREGGFPPDSVVLTFDDAYACLAENVLPETRRLGFHGTVFVASEFVGMSADQARVLNADLSRDILTWEQLRNFASAGWEIGSHTLTHPDLTRLSRALVDRELCLAKDQIEQHIQRPVDTLAYPYGRFDHATKEAAKNYYARACTTRLGFNCGAIDPLRLERVDVHYLRNPRIFIRVCGGGLAAYLRFRQYLRNLKQFVT